MGNALLKWLQKAGLGDKMASGMSKAKEGAGKVKDFYSPSAIENQMRGGMSLVDLTKPSANEALQSAALKKALMRGGASAGGLGIGAGAGGYAMMDDDDDLMKKLKAMGVL